MSSQVEKPPATKKERFGKFVLLEDLESGSLGTEYRAAKLGPTGLEKIVTVLRLGEAICSNPETAKSLLDQVKVAAQLQNPNVLKIYGIGKVESAYYISHEFVEGKSLKTIFNKCRSDAFPFSVDHTLLITSKVCSALEYAHARKVDGGRYIHGLLTPASVLVSYEGEVRVRGFGTWHSLSRDAAAQGPEDVLYLAPEQAAGGAVDTRADTFAVGCLLFEALTGRALGEGRGDLSARIAGARLQNPTGDDDSLPKPLVDILHRSLATDPSGRYAEVQEMRKAVDTLLFSGDFTPTTFNLAFFMHSLFREEIERESKLLKEEREASYFEFVAEEPKAATRPASPPPAPIPATTPVPFSPGSQTKTEPVTLRTPVPEHIVPRETPAPVRAAAHTPIPGLHTPIPRFTPVPAVPREPAPGISAKEAASGFTFHKDERKLGRTSILAGIGVVVVLGAVAGWYFVLGPGVGPSTKAPPPTTLSVEASAAIQRVKELEDRLKAIEEEKAAAEAKAADEAKKKLEDQARARGTTVDPGALAKAQEEASKKARADQEKRAQEEQRKIEEQRKVEQERIAEEQRKAEEQRRAEERRAAEEAARVAMATPAPVTPPPATTPVAPAVKPGTLANLNDPGVIPPIAEQKSDPKYPEIARLRKIEGTVALNILVDEKGNVVDAKVVTAAGGRAGLTEAAIEAVKKWRFRPGTKDGVPVRLWMGVNIQFKLPNR